ncbi:GAP family protein [Mycolicibacterium tusciae]|uniref:GAP family protein n=1 Tax=Mycolicibacterium tusciae TaxID=75922 RepID=UPI00024A22C5|nr:GAP family protein [Mycolicibacterium tusciae]
MWGSLLMLALPIALNPGVLAAILLLVSRPRPVQNLFAFWVGALIVNLPALLIPVVVLHHTPSYWSFAGELDGPAADGGSTVNPIQIGIGVLALLVAALLTARYMARRRARTPSGAGDTSTGVLESETRPPIARPHGRSRSAVAAAGSAIRRLRDSAYTAWENGSTWVAVLFGMVGLLPGPPIVLFVVTTIAASGAGLGTQLIATIVFIVTMLAVMEIILVGCLVAPDKTQAIVQPLHDWARAHRPQLLVGIFAVVGVLQVASGLL